MDITRWLSGLGRGASHEDRMKAVRESHGRKATAWLADKLNASKSQARRYLKGEANPGRASDKTKKNMQKVHRATQRSVAAQKIRDLQTVTPGQVDVVNKSPRTPTPDGSRYIGPVDISGSAGRIADLYEAGDDDGAAREMDRAILDAYGGGGKDSRLSNTLGISGYRDPMRYTTHDDHQDDHQDES